MPLPLALFIDVSPRAVPAYGTGRNTPAPPDAHAGLSAPAHDGAGRTDASRQGADLGHVAHRHAAVRRPRPGSGRRHHKHDPDNEPHVDTHDHDHDRDNEPHVDDPDHHDPDNLDDRNDDCDDPPRVVPPAPAG